MSGKASCWDNAAMEIFFSTYKLENSLDDNSKVLLTPWELQSEIAYWIEGYCNRDRCYSIINYLSPIEYEERTRRERIIYEMAG